MSSQSRRKNATSKTPTPKKSTKTLIEEAMNIRGPKDDSFDISDSTDWLGTPLAQLADVDSLLRCQVFKLKSNAAIEDLVEAFKRARPAALQLARKSAVEPTFTSPKRKRDVSDLYGPDEQENKRTRASTRQATRRLENTEAVEDVIVIDDAGDDADFDPNDGLTGCPVCHRRMTVKSVEAHIEKCLNESETTQPTNKLSKPGFPSPKPIKRPDRLPVVNFSLIKDQALKKKLIDLGISAAGGREMMRKRLTEYTTIWNANCDAKHPRGTGQLKRDLESWERTLGSRAPQPSALSAHIKDKDFDGLSWSSEHRNNFRDLIAQARQKMPNKPPNEMENNAATSTIVSAASSQSLQGVSFSEDTVKKQIKAPVESQRDRPNAEYSSIPPVQALPEITESSYPSSQKRFFAENADQSPESFMEAPPSSQYENYLPIMQMQMQEAQGEMVDTDLNTRGLSPQK
ncbi:E3 ubiquitin-protein ligase rad18 [Ciborinia camelliae]|nr:E3 ubiquitin-protein ligase rad18 [Ciborinia camelliae]